MPDNSNIREIKYMLSEADGPMAVRDILRHKLNMSAKEITRCKQFEDGVMAAGVGEGYRKALVKDVLYPGDILKVRIYEDTDNSSEIVPSDTPIDIVYEDEDLILINKPGDMVVHPSYAHFKDSLSNALAGYYQRSGQNHVIRTIGRLDRETSGLIIFAKNRHSAAVLSNQKESMSRRKEYLAVCDGSFAQKEGTIDAPIASRDGQRMVREVRPDGKRAVTHYKVISQFEDYALVRLRLDTGRTHQIRVHMKYIGHPLLGDYFYGKEIANSRGMMRAALHAYHLEFIHPVTGREMSFDAPLPPDMAGLSPHNIDVF